MSNIKNSKLFKNVLKIVIVILTSVSPTLAVKFFYRLSFGKKLNLKNPKTINEKLQFLKLYTYTNNESVTNLADKYIVKEYINEKYDSSIKSAKLFQVCDNSKKIDFDKLPNKFVLKCNHGCGYNIIVKDKQKIDIDKVKKQLNKWVKTNYWKIYCEPQYKNIKKKIFVEELLEPQNGDILTYTFWCFNGDIRIINIQSIGQHDEEYIDYFDNNWNWLDITSGNHKHNPIRASKPYNFDEMTTMARMFAKDFPFIRVDLYSVDNEIYLSELTFVPGGGYFKLKPTKVLDDMGEWLDISKEVKEKYSKR